MNTADRFTNLFVDLCSGAERECGHAHDDEVDALACSLAGKSETETVITYRDNARGRWQYLGRWALVERR